MTKMNLIQTRIHSPELRTALVLEFNITGVKQDKSRNTM